MKASNRNQAASWNLVMAARSDIAVSLVNDQRANICGQSVGASKEKARGAKTGPFHVALKAAISSWIL